MRDLQQCGSYGAYQRHRKAGEEPCEDCKQARRAYQRDYRKLARRPQSERDNARRRAHRRTLLALARRYPTAFAALLEEELAKEGITQ